MSKSITKRGRMFVYATDVALITGRSYKTALKILNQIRQAYEKPAGALVTYKEFSAFMYLDEQEVLQILQ